MKEMDQQTTYRACEINASGKWEIIKIGPEGEMPVAGPMSQPEAMDWLASNTGKQFKA